MPDRHSGYMARPAPSGLADVIEIILDKGLVIDAYARVSALGIELLTVDARIVVSSVDTYLRFAEATHRLDLEAQGPDSLVDVAIRGAGKAVQAVATKVVEGKVEDVKEKVEEKVEDVKDKIEEKVEDVKEVAQSVAGDVMDKAVDKAQELIEKVLPDEDEQGADGDEGAQGGKDDNDGKDDEGAAGEGGDEG